MSRYVLSPRAQADLDEIWDYTAKRWGMDQAENYIRLLQRAIEIVADDPRKGRPCDEVRRGLPQVHCRLSCAFLSKRQSRHRHRSRLA